jgi:NhaP-type Na+/H+ and K+/H+ antiporter
VEPAVWLAPVATQFKGAFRAYMFQQLLSDLGLSAIQFDSGKRVPLDAFNQVIEKKLS